VIDESLEIPDEVRELQIKLYRKAKSEPDFRFYLLYDKMYRAGGVLHGPPAEHLRTPEIALTASHIRPVSPAVSL
jgi:hypothetical protein